MNINWNGSAESGNICYVQCTLYTILSYRFIQMVTMLESGVSQTGKMSTHTQSTVHTVHMKWANRHTILHAVLFKYYKFMVEKPQHDTENIPQNSFENCYPHIIFYAFLNIQMKT